MKPNALVETSDRPAPAGVALAGVIGYGYGNLAAVYLRNWAYRDPQIKAGVRIECLEFESGSSPELAAKRILETRPALVGLSCYLWTSAQIFRICAQLKELSPDTPILVGGPDVASLPETILERHPEVDFVACGEGEETFLGLLRCLLLKDRPLSGVAGLVTREGGRVSRSSDAALIDMNEAPLVYADGGDVPETAAMLESSRGCPFLCSFCDWGPRKMRYVSLDRLEREFRALAPKVQWIHLCDADLLMDKKRGLAVMEAFLKAAEGTGCTLKFDTNPIFMHREVADMIARAPGRFYVTLGLQTTNEASIKKIERHLDLPKVEENLAYLAKAAPQAQLLFSIIFGLPGDDLAGFRRTLDWIFRWSYDHIGACQLLVIPGSDLARAAAASGVEHQGAPPYQVLRTDTMTAADIKRARELAFHAEFLDSVKPCQEALSSAWSAIPPAEEGRRVALFEGWIDHLKAQDVDLTFGAPAFSTDDLRFEERLDASLEKIREDRLLLATVIQATWTYARKHGAELPVGS